MSGIGQVGLANPSGIPHPMPDKDNIRQGLPALRRYARALTGTQQSGDAFVRATLEAALESPELRARVSRSRVELYAVFSEIWNSANIGAGRQAEEPENGRDRLALVSPIQRQALLLAHLEEFSLVEAGEVLGLAPEEAAVLIGQAIVEIERDAATDVLVIEDEPLISSHIETIVEEMGHRVVAVATTSVQASAAYAMHRPGLVLADVQLADDSSGLTAVDEILALAPIPIIFITAYPEQLLTGERPEPSFLVAKPFREESLRATISQALFFGAQLDA